jgi:hypothetical protein
LLLSNASADVGGLGGNGDDFVPAPPPPATANIDDGGAATHASTHNVLNVISPAGTCNTAASSSSSMAAAAATDATKFLHELKSPGDFSVDVDSASVDQPISSSSLKRVLSQPQSSLNVKTTETEEIMDLQAKKQRISESDLSVKAPNEEMSQPMLKRQRVLQPLPEQAKKLEELNSYAKGMGYTLDITLKPTETTSLYKGSSKANLKVALDNQTSHACSNFLVDYNIEFSTLVDHASPGEKGSTTTKFWIIVSKLPTGSKASCLITISQAGVNDRRGVKTSLLQSNAKAFMFLLEAIVWIFCFGTDLKFDTIEATAYVPSNGTYPSFQKFPREILRLILTASGSYTITADYRSTYNISHIPVEW